MPAKPRNLRRGLRPLSCHCGARAYMTWAQVEQHGLPIHGRCNEPYLPDDLELAMHLGLEDAPAVIEYGRQVASILQGRKGTDSGGRHIPREERKSREARMHETELAAVRVEAERAAIALRNRLAALRPAAEPIPF